MDLVERYLEAVKFWLPAHLKDDVAAELAEDIRSEIEEAERAKGRPLTEDEIAALLKARGRPMLVASKYLPQHSLIGPELYPVYIFVLKIVALVSLAAAAAGWALQSGFGNGFVPEHVPSFQPLNSLLVAFAVVTLIFAVIERRGLDPVVIDKWNPKTLRPVADKSRIKRSASVGDIAANLVLVCLFFAGYLSQTQYDFRHGHIAFSPEWVPYWQVIMVFAFAEIALSATNLFRPYWSALRILLRLCIDIGKTAAFCWLLQSHFLRAIWADGVPDQAFAQLIRIGDTAARLALPIFALFALGIGAAALWRLFHLKGGRGLAAA